MLSVENVHTYYGNIHALKGVSLDVNQGEIVTLIGANGAGKSTTLKTISGLLKPREGAVQLRGEDLRPYPAHRIVEKGVVLVPEGRHVFAVLTVMENLEMGPLLAATKRPSRRTWSASSRSFPACESGAGNWPVRSPAASSRCWPWGAR